MNKIERSVSTLDSDVLRTFISVAEHGNVTRAAEALHRTQSAISVQVKRMEDNLGVKLFAREAPIEGRVRVGIPDDYGTELLAAVLADFAARHPLVEVSIRCGFSVGFPTAVDRNELDLAVYACDQNTTRGEILLEEQTVWAGNMSTTLHTLDPLPVTLFDRSCWWRDAAIDALNSAATPYRIAYSSESVAGIKAAIRAGLAIGVLARSTVEPDMRILGPGDGLPSLPTSNLMLIGGSETETPAMTAMADSIRRGFSTLVGRR